MLPTVDKIAETFSDGLYTFQAIQYCAPVVAQYPNSAELAAAALGHIAVDVYRLRAIEALLAADVNLAPASAAIQGTFTDAFYAGRARKLLARPSQAARTLQPPAAREAQKGGSSAAGGSLLAEVNRQFPTSAPKSLSRVADQAVAPETKLSRDKTADSGGKKGEVVVFEELLTRFSVAEAKTASFWLDYFPVIAAPPPPTPDHLSEAVCGPVAPPRELLSNSATEGDGTSASRSAGEQPSDSLAGKSAARDDAPH